MKNTLYSTILAAAAVGLLSIAPARANLISYDITFDQTGESNQYGNAVPPSDTHATGIVVYDDVLNVAVSGTFNVSSGPRAGNYLLVSIPPTGNTGVWLYDNILYPGSSPFLSSTGGLLFTADGNASTANGVNMWYNTNAQFSQPAGTYSLWGNPPTYNPEAYGTATLTPHVPDGGTTLVLLGGALTGLGALRRKFRA
jgi:hypothetical protein